MAKHWYVIQAYSGREMQAKRSLEERIKQAGMSDLFDKVLVPTEEVIEVRKGKRRKSERKFFPGYVFVHMEMNDDTWHLIKSVPHLLGFVGGGNNEKPVPISEKEAESLLQRVQESSEKPKPKILFEPGEEVRVIDGPFSDFTGQVQKVDYEHNRLTILVSILGRSTPVDLEFYQVEKTI